MISAVIAFVVLALTLFIVAVIFFKCTKIGKKLWLRVFGSADEAMGHDASTPEGAAAYYNSAIEARRDDYAKANALYGQINGKIVTYNQQLRDAKKKKMQYDLDLKKCIDSGDDESAKVFIRKQTELEDQIQILKQNLTELESNAEVQKEVVDNLAQEVEALKAEKEKSVLTLETAQTIKSLKVDSPVATTEQDKMLEKVRDGVQKAGEEATGHRIAYENSASVQEKRLDQKMREADVEAKLQALKNAAKKS